MSNKTSSDGPPREAPTPDLDAKTLSVNEVNQMFAYAFERLRASGSGTTTAVEAMPKIVKSAPAVGEPFVCAHGTWTRPHVIRCNVCWDAQSSGTTTAGAPANTATMDFADYCRLKGDAALGRALREALAALSSEEDVVMIARDGDVRNWSDTVPVVTDETRALAALLSSPPGPSEARE
jgi:hypothetical protein